MRKAFRRRGVLLTAATVLTVVLVALGLIASAAVGTRDSAGEAPGIAASSPAGPAPYVAGDPDGGSFAQPGTGAETEALSPEGLSAEQGGTAGAKSGIMAAPTPQSAPTMAKIAPPMPGPDGGAAPVSPDVAPDRSVIRNARLTLEVKDLPAVSATVRDTAASVGGFVATEHSVDRSSSFTLRVPSNRLDEVMGRLAASGTVTERFGQAQDVTDQMVDLQSRLTTQKASVARVRALLERADTVGEVVAVESELASREAELESMQRRLASLNGQVSLSTLTVSLSPAPGAAPEPDNGFLAGLAAGWRAFLATTGGLLTALGAVLPFALLLALVIGAGLLGRRAVRRHRAATAALAAVSGGSGKP